MNKLENIGYIIGVLGVAIILIWIGIFKFTPTEAKAIQPLVSTSPPMKWMYSLFSEQAVSNIIGSIEILTGFLLLLSFRWPLPGLVGGILGSLTFLLTLSFLFSSQSGFEKVDGIWLPDAFILNDIMALGLCIIIVAKNWK